MLSSPWTECCYTLFTGAPSRGHLPVFQTLTIPGVGKETKRKVFDYDNADWESWRNKLDHVLLEKLEQNDNEEPAELFYFSLILLITVMMNLFLRKQFVVTQKHSGLKIFLRAFYKTSGSTKELPVPKKIIPNK